MARGHARRAADDHRALSGDLHRAVPPRLAVGRTIGGRRSSRRRPRARHPATSTVTRTTTTSTSRRRRDDRAVVERRDEQPTRRRSHRRRTRRSVLPRTRATITLVRRTRRVALGAERLSEARQHPGRERRRDRHALRRCAPPASGTPSRAPRPRCSRSGSRPSVATRRRRRRRARSPTFTTSNAAANDSSRRTAAPSDGAPGREDHRREHTPAEVRERPRPRDRPRTRSRRGRCRDRRARCCRSGTRRTCA